MHIYRGNHTYSRSSDSGTYNHLTDSMTDRSSAYPMKRKCKGVYKPWMNYVNKYSLLSNDQRESLDLFFINNQIKLTKKNIRSIASELKISYKKIINYVYEKNYEHMLVIETAEDNFLYNLNYINRELEYTWERYLEMAKYFRDVYYM